MDRNVLEDIGMTGNESKVYLALLELGSCSASQIIQKTNLHRAVVYDLLERLNEKGLVGTVINGRKKFFEATNPERLIEILKEKEEKINNILPQLMELSKFTTKLEVKIYKGKEGLKTVFEDILRAKPKEWLVLGSMGQTYKNIPYYLEQFHKKRIKEKIFLRGLMLDVEESKLRKQQLQEDKYAEIRLMPKNFKTPTVINIYSERIALFSKSEEEIPFVILIENKELSKSFKEYFESIWCNAKK